MKSSWKQVRSPNEVLLTRCARKIYCTTSEEGGGPWTQDTTDKLRGHCNLLIIEGHKEDLKSGPDGGRARATIRSASEQVKAEQTQTT